MSPSTDDTQAKTFKVFPEFSKLRFVDKGQYQAMLAGYPPISDVSFVSAMSWWETVGDYAVSRLNGNLIISYWFPGDDRFSGLSIFGTKNIDETVSYLLDHLGNTGEEKRLVHMPEFVVSSLHHPELFTFEQERAFDEYLYDVSDYYPLSHMPERRRKRVRKFLSQVDEKKVATRTLDLGTLENRQLLLDSMRLWGQKGVVNGIGSLSDKSLEVAVMHAEEFGLENLCLFVKGELCGFCLYYMPPDKRYAVVTYARINYDSPYMVDCFAYVVSKWFTELHVTYLNFEPDFGIPQLRAFKLSLGPCNYFRKYTVRPT